MACLFLFFFVFGLLIRIESYVLAVGNGSIELFACCLIENCLSEKRSRRQQKRADVWSIKISGMKKESLFRRHTNDEYVIFGERVFYIKYREIR